MIRINLLPQSKRPARMAQAAPQGQGWLVAYALGTVAWLALLAVLYVSYSDRLEDQQKRNAYIVGHVERLKASSGDLEGLKAKLDRSLQLEEVVQKLQQARLGPTRVLRELIRVLSLNGKPTTDPERLERLRQENPLAGFSSSWDVRRLWLYAFEEENRDCKIRGFGKTNEDVAEFLRRLAISDFFENVTLEKTEAKISEALKASVIDFLLSCKVRY